MFNVILFLCIKNKISACQTSMATSFRTARNTSLMDLLSGRLIMSNQISIRFHPIIQIDIRVDLMTKNFASGRLWFDPWSQRK